MSCATAKRRRKQAVNKYRHIAPLRRPNYKLRDAQVSQRRLQQRIETERRMKMAPKKSK